MRILLLSRYSRLAASTRLRFLQYIPYIDSEGIEITHEPLLDDEYLKKLYAGNPISLGSIITSYIRRIKILLKQTNYDLLWIQYELFPWLPSWIEQLATLPGVPCIVDYDDAFFHRYNMHKNYIVRRMLGDKIDKVMRGASIVIAGNEYLAERAQDAGCKRVEIIPTVVDLNRYPKERLKSDQVFTIGWIGSPMTSHYIPKIRHALREVCTGNKARVVLIGSGPVSLDGVPIERRAWSEEDEVRDIHSFDVGIMPLSDTPWERGKCGFKLIQYMACGKPVVASAVGSNSKIVEHGVTGFLVNDLKGWFEALETLRTQQDLCHCMGSSGRQEVEARYCLQVTAPRLLKLIHEAVNS
jgi:glycosyltransferase involved in cell wall biosynthesis